MRPNPLGLIAELTHRCPLRCLYCSNPTELIARNNELPTSDWLRVIKEAAALGVLQIYFTGGEPCLRPDLVSLAQAASQNGLYTNLITSGVGFTQSMCDQLVQAGLDHIQLSIQDIDRRGAKFISGVHAIEQKVVAAKIIRAAPVAFTVNIVVHRHNLSNLRAMIQAAADFGATKVEIAHVQYNGWALKNRATLLPSEEQVQESLRVINEAKTIYLGQIRFDFVLPDYFARAPKACMNGWAQQMILIDPQGQTLPCHSATTIPDVNFPNVKTQSLKHIWQESALFNLFRGDQWMKEPCRSCPKKAVDFGGCRCQALALTGDATNADPICQLSPHHHVVEAAVASQDDEAPVRRPALNAAFEKTFS